MGLSLRYPGPARWHLRKIDLLHLICHTVQNKSSLVFVMCVWAPASDVGLRRKGLNPVTYLPCSCLLASFPDEKMRLYNDVMC